MSTIITHRNPRKAFTIVELIIVIAVIGVLAAILIPTFANVIRKANISSVKSAVKNLNTAVVTESADEEYATQTSMSIDEALIKVARSGYGIDSVICKKDGLDIMWAPLHNRFVVVSTTGAGPDTAVIDVLFPQDIAEEAQAAAGGVTGYINIGGLQSTKLVSAASDAKIEAYKTQIITNHETTVTVSGASDLASLAKMSSAYGPGGTANAAYATQFEGITIEITGDMYFGGTIWTPFGENPKKPFMGDINGNGHTIYGLSNAGYPGGYEFTSGTVKSLGESYGLLAYVGTPKNGGSGTTSTTISDLTIENVSINSDSGLCVGAFVGYVMANGADAVSSLTLINCKATGSISGQNDIGGLVGKFYGNHITLENCESNVTVKAQTGTTIWATKGGGLIGYTSPSAGKTVTLKNCVNNGSVTIINVAANDVTDRNKMSTAYAGGLIGGNGSSKGTYEFENCTNNGAVSAQANSSECAGQIMGSIASNSDTTYIFRGTNVMAGTVDADTFGQSFAYQANNACYNITLTSNPAVILFGYTNLMCYTDAHKPVVKYSANATLNGVSIAGSSIQSTSYLHVDAPVTVSVPLVAE